MEDEGSDLTGREGGGLCRAFLITLISLRVVDSVKLCSSCSFIFGFLCRASQNSLNWNDAILSIGTIGVLLGKHVRAAVVPGRNMSAYGSRTVQAQFQFVWLEHGS